MITIGIDLGTTNSLGAYLKDGKPYIIPNVFGKNLTPSIISLDDNGEVLVGEIARERIISHPSVTVSNFKRFMGTNKVYKLGRHKFTPEELSSFVLRSIKEDAESFLGEEITDAVISIPAYFNDAQRNATKRAGALAGLNVKRLISEPTSAALAYGLEQADDETQFLVFDLGGGTFDVSILEIFEGVMEVKSIAGDNYLGGEDFNNALIEYFLEKNDIDRESLDINAMVAIQKQAENCKKELSNQDSSVMSLRINDEKIETTITREKFFGICDELLLRLRIPVQKAIKDADVDIKELDSIILMGGSTRMPIVKSMVSKMFNTLPFSNINPDETVALGAAVQAGLINKDEALDEVILTDVCPYTLGISLYDTNAKNYENASYFEPIIERNSPIPISRIHENLVTLRDGQTTVSIEVYQGESRRLENNIKLGNLDIKIPKAKAGEEPFSVRFTYDINGILEVETTIKSTGEKRNMVIQNSSKVFSDEELKVKVDEMQKIKIHPRDKADNRLLMAKLEREYEESLGERRQYISEIIRTFENALESQDEVRINALVEEINELLPRI